MRTTIDFDQIREDHNLPDWYTDKVLIAFADDWFDFDSVPWDEIQDAFVGDFTASSEDEAIGDYLFDLYTDTSDFDPNNILHRYVDWEMFGRDERLSGYFRAVRPEIGDNYYVFRTACGPAWVPHRLRGAPYVGD